VSHCPFLSRLQQMQTGVRKPGSPGLARASRQEPRQIIKRYFCTQKIYWAGQGHCNRIVRFCQTFFASRLDYIGHVQWDSRTIYDCSAETNRLPSIIRSWTNKLTTKLSHANCGDSEPSYQDVN